MTKLRFFKNWWEKQDTATRILPGYLWNAVTNYTRYGTKQAAALSYYAIFSIFPLTLLLAVLISGILGPAVAQEQIVNGLSLFFPDPQTTNLLQENVIEALQQSSSFGVVAIIGLIWSGLGLFTNVSSALDVIFAVPSRRSLWLQRVVALLMALMLVVLVTASFVTSGVLRLVSVLMLDRAPTWVTIGTVFLPLGLNMVIFALLFRYVPARQVYWDAVWPAAITGAVGWELAKAGFAWFLGSVANYQFVYGSIAAVIALLFWAYLLASIFLFSAELCASLNTWFNIQMEQNQQDGSVVIEQALPPHVRSR